MEELEKTLGYHFKHRELLRTALTHKSYNEGNRKETVDNDRLEFLGDSVINLIVTDHLFRRLRKMNEGELSKLKAHMVSSDFLFGIAHSLSLGEYVLLGKGEERNEGRKNRKILASLLEAVVGAVYMDSNFKVASSILTPYFQDFLEELEDKELRINDYKSELQEIVQKHGSVLPLYEILDETGKPPNLVFNAAVFIENREIGRGSGKSKRQAEQDAAASALKKINEFIKYEKLSEVFFLKND